jgi:cysteine desulfurase
MVGLATAIRLCCDALPDHHAHVSALRKSLWQQLGKAIDGLKLNGPSWSAEQRIPGNLNLVLPDIEGEAWMSAAPEVAFSSGSACSGAEATPSHVLTAIGLSESEARRSVRFGVGRFNTAVEIDQAAKQLIEAYKRVAQLAC